jgi:hypothetical protein
MDRILEVLQNQIDRLDRDIALISDGYKTTHEMRGGEWVDTTQETLNRAGAELAELQDALTSHQGRLAQQQ